MIESDNLTHKLCKSLYLVFVKLFLLNFLCAVLFTRAIEQQKYSHFTPITKNNQILNGFFSIYEKKKILKKIITKHVSNSTYHGVKNAVKIACKNYRVKLIKRGYMMMVGCVCIFFLLCSATAFLNWLRKYKSF